LTGFGSGSLALTSSQDRRSQALTGEAGQCQTDRVDWADLCAVALTELEAELPRLPTAQLCRVRWMLRHSGEFPPGADLDRVLLAVDDVLAERLGCAAEDLPGSLLAVPDTVPE
jgi:hypothetical protein